MKNKIYIIANTINGKSGLDKAISEMLNSFSYEKIEVALIILANKNHANPGFSINPEVPRHYVWDVDIDSFSQGDLEWLSKKGPGFKLKIPFLDIELSRRAVLNFKWLVKHQACKNDLIIFTHPVQSYLVKSFGWKLDASTVLQIHGNYEELDDLRQLLISSHDAINFLQIITPGMRRGIEKIAPNNTIVDIPNFYTHKLNNKTTQSSRFRIGFIGSFQERKNQLGALRLLYITLNNLGRSFPLELIYFGEDKNAYGNSVKKALVGLDLSKNVRFEGVKSTDEIYSEVDAVLMLSTSEGFSYVMVEAAHYRKPLFLFNFDYGPKDFIKDGLNGFSTEWGEYELLASKLCQAINNKNLLVKVVESAYYDVKEIFNPKIIISKYSALGQHVQEKKPHKQSSETTSTGCSILGCYVNGNQVRTKVFVSNAKNIGIVDARIFLNGSSLEPFQRIQSNKHEIIFEFIKNESIVDSSIYINYGRKWIYAGTVSNQHTVVLHYECINHPHRPQSALTTLSDVDHFGQGHSLYLALPFRGGVTCVESSLTGKTAPKTITIPKNDLLNRQWVQLNGSMDGVVHIHGPFKEKYSVTLPKISVGTIADSIRLIEEEYSLYSRSESGVFWWELIRANLSDLIMETNLSWDTFTVSPDFFPTLTQCIDDNKKIKTFERLIFSHPTIRLNESDDYWRTYFKKNSSVDSLEKTAFIRFTPDNKISVEHFINEYHQNELTLTPPSKVEKIKALSKETHEAASTLSNAIRKKLGVRLIFTDLIKNKVNKFLTEQDFYRNMFDKSEIKEIFIPSAYWQPAMVNSARENQIKIFDLQYSAILKNHPNYFIPYEKRNYKDDKLYIHSQSLDAVVLCKERPAVICNPNQDILKVRKPRYASPSKYHSFCFISQGRLSVPIVQTAIRAANKKGEALVTLVLHPTETLTPKLTEELMLSRITIFRGIADFIARNDRNIFVESLAVGVYSSALLDLYEQGIDVAIMKLPGWDFYETWLDSGLFLCFSESH